LKVLALTKLFKTLWLANSKKLFSYFELIRKKIFAKNKKILAIPNLQDKTSLSFFGKRFSELDFAQCNEKDRI
jgi:hypothetical protein